MTNFQAHSKHSGNEFEDFVEAELRTIGTVLEKDYLVEGSGCEADFVVKMKRRKEYVECKGGNGELRGAQRTDNVKKAIANGTLMKLTNRKIYYVVYFSGKPKPGSYSEQMINTALKHKIINEVRYREDYDA